MFHQILTNFLLYHNPDELLTDDIDIHLVDQTLNKLWKDLANEGMVDPRSLSKFYADQYLPSEIPNLYHYIWFGCKRKFLPYHYLSVLSALSVQKACQVFFHTDCEPPADNLLFQHLKETSVFYLMKL